MSDIVHIRSKSNHLEIQHMETIQQRLEQDEISLQELFKVLWNGRWLIVSVTMAITLIAGVAAWLTPKMYKASVIISPVSENSSSQLGSLSSLASQFGGLASLAGISVGGDSKKSESLAVLQSETLTEKYIRDNNLLSVLYQDEWDAEKHTWTETDPEEIPTLWKANKYFGKKVRNVTSDTKTGVVTLTIVWRDPQLAAKWANELVGLANDYLRKRAIEESERNIIYLTDQAAKTDVVGVKQAIYSILQVEINKIMLARGNEEYAFKILDPAIPPEQKDSPKQLLWMASGLVAGILFSVLILITRNSMRIHTSVVAAL